MAWQEDEESEFMDIDFNKNETHRVLRLRKRMAEDGGTIMTFECKNGLDISDLKDDLHEFGLCIARSMFSNENIVEEDRGITFRGVNVKTLTFGSD